MTASPSLQHDMLHAALRAHASGSHPAGAGVELLISHGSLLSRTDFRDRFVHLGTSISDDTAPMATIDWAGVFTALNTEDLPCSGGERRILQIAASVAHGTPVDLRDCLTGLDHSNIQRVITAVLHASGQRPAPTLH